MYTLTLILVHLFAIINYLVAYHHHKIGNGPKHIRAQYRLHFSFVKGA